MQTSVVVVRADREPIAGLADPGPHQIYKNPRVAVEARTLGALDPGALRVQVIYAGLCGTDLHVAQADPRTGYIRSSAPLLIEAAGRILGHEAVGRVLATGAHVSHVEVGQCVAFESIVTCHRCDRCRRGQFNQCRQARLLGLQQDGVFGAVVDLPAQLAHDVGSLADSDAGLRAAACIEPASVAWVACETSRVAGGDVVVVFGGGPIGVLAALLARLVFGAAHVSLVEPNPFRREFARRFCDRTYDVEEFLGRPAEPFDVLIEASGELANVTRSFRRLAPNGRIALLARSGQPLALDAVDHMITGAISLFGSRGNLGGAFDRIIGLCQRGRLPLHDIVTRIGAGPEALCGLLRQPQQVLGHDCKVLIRF